MGFSSSKAASPPKVSNEKKNTTKNVKALVSYSKNSDGGKYKSSVRKEVAVTVNPSQNRCLRVAGITDKRLEIVAMTDFKALKSGRNNTLAGQMFDQRVLERKTNLESVKQIVGGLERSDIEAYTNVLNQYKSALTAAQSEFALLKLLLLLQKYSTHCTRFLDFFNEYEPPEGLDLNWLGNSTETIIKKLCGARFDNQPDAATLKLAQILLAINCSSYGVSPSTLRGITTNLPVGKLMYEINASMTTQRQRMYDIAFISRDLTFSREMTRIRDDEEPDEKFKELVESKLGPTFITSPREVKENILVPFVGSSAYTNMRTTISNQDDTKFSNLSGYLSNKRGVMSKLRHGSNILLPESFETKYQSRTYSTIEPLVNEAFEGENVLDFSSYSTAVTELIDECHNLSEFGMTAFRIGEKAAESNGEFRTGIPLVAEEQPLSPAAVAASVLDVFNRRCASTIQRSIQGNKFYDWLTPEHINYTKIQAWILIRENPDLAKRIVYGVLNDYYTGFLTPAALPTPIAGTADVDSEGNEIAGTEELSELAYFKPGTETLVNLSSRSTSLISSVIKVNKYFAEDVPNMSPSNVLSSNPADDVSFPQIRTQYERNARDVLKYFGSSNQSKNDPDLRLINCIYNRKVTIHNDGSESERNDYLGSKIITAEIADAVLEVLRGLVTPFTSVEASADGDPAFPYVPQMPSPYGTSKWNYSEAGYEQFQLNQWVDTITKWDQLFTRSTGEGTPTFMRRRNIYRYSDKIIDILRHFMGAYSFLQLRSETINDGVTIEEDREWAGHGAVKYGVYFYPVCATIKLSSSLPFRTISRDSADTMDAVTEYFSEITNSIDDMFLANFDDFEESMENILDGLSTTYARRTGARSAPTKSFISNTSQLLLDSYREQKQLHYLFDFIKKYGDRVQSYKDAVLELTEGEGTPLGELITSLRGAGDAGTDVLQSLSVNQMALKQIALEEETGDEDNAYLPKLSVISDSEINSVKALCNEPILKSPEGDTTKVIFVGLPNGIFDKNNIDDEFCLRVSYTDIEYPQLVFRSKSYKFHKDLYVLPNDLDSVGRTTRGFNNVLNQMTFSKIRVEVIESDDMNATIQIEDDIETIEYNSRLNRDICTNLAVSELMKIYYRLMIGVNMSEISFLSDPNGLNIEISPALANLATTLGEQIQNSSAAGAIGISSDITSLLQDTTSFEDVDNFASGEISTVDEALLVDLKNAYQTRLFSPGLMRSNILSAKLFDRVFAIPVDPDEFYIVPPGDPQIGDVATQQQIFDFYLDAGIIEETGEPAPYAYKLAPRKSAEGSMAFGNVTVSLTTVGDENERLLGL